MKVKWVKVWGGKRPPELDDDVEVWARLGGKGWKSPISETREQCLRTERRRPSQYDWNVLCEYAIEVPEQDAIDVFLKATARRRRK